MRHNARQSDNNNNFIIDNQNLKITIVFNFYNNNLLLSPVNSDITSYQYFFNISPATIPQQKGKK